MARNHVSLTQLVEGKYYYTINVRVTRIWDGMNLNTGQIINMNAILSDKEVLIIFEDKYCRFHTISINITYISRSILTFTSLLYRIIIYGWRLHNLQF